MTVVSGQSGTGKTDHQYSYLQTAMQVNDSGHVAEQIFTSVLTLYIHAGSHTIIISTSVLTLFIHAGSHTILYPRRFSPYKFMPVLTLYYIHVGSHPIYTCRFSHYIISTSVLTLYIHASSQTIIISTSVLTLYIHAGSDTILYPRRFSP